ncbi:MAG: 2-octaprenyl-6-methoxyphenyl hydroxylase [Gammaproteobacteria bacterium]|nr:2-octaprenyl-6-methoxyphenyl hydroxylase [Gammaproteobacteria bacterium]
MKSDYDILIIGGGMVGASLACALGGHGLRIGVIEAVPLTASTQPSYDERTIALAFGSRRIFEGIGVWGEVARLGATPIEKIHISDRGRFGFTHLSRAELGQEALGYVVEARVLGLALLARLQQLPNVAWLCPATLESVDFQPESAVACVSCNGATHDLTARLVVAADGADSAVRSAAGVDFERTQYGQSAVVTTVTISQPHHNTAYERFTGTGPLALLPMSSNRMAVVWSTRTDNVETLIGLSNGEYLARLQERFGDRLGPLTRLGKRRAYPLVLTRVKEHVRPRLVLIGNAAHTVHPVAGQGFNLGLRDVAALAEVLAAATQEGCDLGDPEVLKRYADWRARDNKVISAFTNSLIRVFSNDFPPLALARNLGLIVVDLVPPLKRRLLRVTSGLAGKLPRLARGLPL